MTVGSSVKFGVRTTGEFSQDVLPFIVMGGVILLRAFGTYKLARLLRR